jgi:hypothetical protein
LYIKNIVTPTIDTKQFEITEFEWFGCILMLTSLDTPEVDKVEHKFRELMLINRSLIINGQPSFSRLFDIDDEKITSGSFRHTDPTTKIQIYHPVYYTPNRIINKQSASEKFVVKYKVDPDKEKNLAKIK